MRPKVCAALLYTTVAYVSFHKNALLSDSRGNLFTLHLKGYIFTLLILFASKIFFKNLKKALHFDVV